MASEESATGERTYRVVYTYTKLVTHDVSAYTRDHAVCKALLATGHPHQDVLPGTFVTITRCHEVVHPED